MVARDVNNFWDSVFFKDNSRPCNVAKDLKGIWESVFFKDMIPAPVKWQEMAKSIART